MLARKISGPLFLIALFFGLLAFSAEAQTAKGKAKTKTALALQDAALAKQLHDANGLIATAKHDYEGHRAAALHQVHKAVHLLHKNGHRIHTAAPVVADPTAEDQATSDAQLKTALTSIAAVQTALANLPASQHRTKAAEHLAVALVELQTALKIK